jgi:hypothetical protein
MKGSEVSSHRTVPPPRTAYSLRHLEVVGSGLDDGDGGGRWQAGGTDGGGDGERGRGRLAPVSSGCV